jgi:putative transposase
VKYACLTRHRREYPVRLMCRVLDVAPSGYYAWRRCGPTARAVADERLMLNVRVAFDRSNETYGAPRVHRELRADGLQVGKKRIARLMRQGGLVGHTPRRRGVSTTDSRHSEPIAPNVVARRFDVSEFDPNGVRAVNRVWASDITYIPTTEGWLYLAVVLDLASRRVIGWAMREQVDAELALAALRMALETRRPSPGLIHHSDRGVQYACGEYRALLSTHQLIASMSRTGDCWDNAVVESFFATLERELIDRNRWPTRDAARRAIFRYIETWYNPHRRHSTLDYLSPAEYERQLAAAA